MFSSLLPGEQEDSQSSVNMHSAVPHGSSGNSNLMNPAHKRILHNVYDNSMNHYHHHPVEPSQDTIHLQSTGSNSTTANYPMHQPNKVMRYDNNPINNSLLSSSSNKDIPTDPHAHNLLMLSTSESNLRNTTNNAMFMNEDTYAAAPSLPPIPVSMYPPENPVENIPVGVKYRRIYEYRVYTWVFIGNGQWRYQGIENVSKPEFDRLLEKERIYERGNEAYHTAQMNNVSNNPSMNGNTTNNSLSPNNFSMNLMMNQQRTNNNIRFPNGMYNTNDNMNNFPMSMQSKYDMNRLPMNNMMSKNNPPDFMRSQIPNMVPPFSMQSNAAMDNILPLANIFQSINPQTTKYMHIPMEIIIAALREIKQLGILDSVLKVLDNEQLYKEFLQHCHAISMDGCFISSLISLNNNNNAVPNLLALNNTNNALGNTNITALTTTTATNNTNTTNANSIIPNTSLSATSSAGSNTSNTTTVPTPAPTTNSTNVPNLDLTNALTNKAILTLLSNQQQLLQTLQTGNNNPLLSLLLMNNNTNTIGNNSSVSNTNVSTSSVDNNSSGSSVNSLPSLSRNTTNSSSSSSHFYSIGSTESSTTTPSQPPPSSSVNPDTISQ